MAGSSRRGDASQVAWAVVQEATGQAKPARPKDAAAVARGRAGGLARAQRLTPERRREIAQEGVAARRRAVG
jgi:hypothetical protein